MKKKVMILVLLSAAVCLASLSSMANAANAAGPQEKAKQAKSIDTSASVGSTHPEIAEGVSCGDCHEMKLDANTTATQMWLSGEYLGKKKGEGVMTEDQLWSEIGKLIGGVKKDTKTYIMATSMNNRPLSTTAEFTFDPKKKVLYGMHEMNTEKLAHIKANPWVSLNWHDEFVGIEGPYRCCQIKGRCQLLEGTDPEFEKVLIDLAPYEDAAIRMMPPNPTPEQREQVLKNLRDQVFKKRFLMSKITIDRITVVNKDFMKQGFRNVQRWESKDTAAVK